MKKVPRHETTPSLDGVQHGAHCIANRQLQLARNANLLALNNKRVVAQSNKTTGNASLLRANTLPNFRLNDEARRHRVLDCNCLVYRNVRRCRLGAVHDCVYLREPVTRDSSIGQVTEDKVAQCVRLSGDEP